VYQVIVDDSGSNNVDVEEMRGRVTTIFLLCHSVFLPSSRISRIVRRVLG
jgi:hypothetical protein